MSQVLACFKCKVYTPIIPDNANNKKFLINFRRDHTYHTVCILHISEMNKQYKKI